MTYHAEFRFDHDLRLDLQMFNHREHRWHWTHLYAPQQKGYGSPEVVNQLRIAAAYIDGVLQLPLRVTMEIVFPALRGKQFLAGMDVSPGSKVYVEFHYGDPDATQMLRLMRIEVGARRFVDLPREATAADYALVMPAADFPFPVLERLPLTWGCFYRVPFMVEGEHPVRSGVVEWPMVDVRASLDPS